MTVSRAQQGRLAAAGPSRVPLSRGGAGGRYRCDVHAQNLNRHCCVGGNPFRGPLRLTPNPPRAAPPSVVFGPFTVAPYVNRIMIVAHGVPRGRNEHVLRLEAQALDGREVVATTRLLVRRGLEGYSELRFDPPRSRRLSLRLRLGFEQLDRGSRGYGAVEIPSIVGYEGGRLVDLCNAAGTDKGTGPRVGEGRPHCYAAEYEPLLSAMRESRFSMLEIGLQSERSSAAHGQDAPSLRVWREFFPRATIYGFDVDDFSSFRQPRTRTFRGDQSSRADLERFISAVSEPELGLVIDDGSHASSHQQVALGTLFRHVAPAGTYIIEDVHWQPYKESPTTLQVMRRFARDGTIHSPFLRPAESRYLERSIESVELRRPNVGAFIAIRKKARS